MSDIMQDSRFSKYLKDPRYKQIPKHKRKIKIDKRFQSMFNDEKFKVKYTVDKRGRPVNETSTENLRKYYEIEESDDSSVEDDSKDKTIDSDSHSDHKYKEGKSVKKSCTPDDKKDLNVNDKLVRGALDLKIKEKLHDLEIDYARGEGLLLSESSSDEETSEDEREDDLEHEWGELDAHAETTDESTKRIAICNMDWDNIKAADIMVLLNSFLPPGGIIHTVTIYPSEFGLKRMQEEEIHGPMELTAEKQDPEHSENSDNEEGSGYHMEKLRRYQLNRLKYYYAVVVCDSVQTADKLYSECDGMEYESSATRLDMRFIPDEVDFDQEPKEVCNKMPDLSRYKPRLFTTTALQQAKVDLTWDTTNPNRTELIKSAVTGNVDDEDLKNYVALSSEDEDENSNDSNNEPTPDCEEDPIQKYKKLLQDIEDTERKKTNKDMEMEITWGLGIKTKAEQLVKKSQEENKHLTPFEKLIEKRKAKKKLKKMKAKETDDHDQSEESDIPSDIDMSDPYFAEEFKKPEFAKSKNKKRTDQESEQSSDGGSKAELELLLDDETDGRSHFSLKKIQEAENISKKSKRKNKLKAKMKEERQTVPEFEMDLNDQRFSALFESHLYNIDPSDPNFKRTKNMEKLIQEKLKRRPVDVECADVPQKQSKEEAALNVLVKNIKRKTKYK